MQLITKKVGMAVGLAGALLLPAISFGAEAGFTSIQGSLVVMSNFINALIPFIISIGLVLFLIGIVQYITAGGDEEKRKAARDIIVFGIIALFVMVSVWGFVNILGKTFFPSGGTTLPNYIPTAPNPSQYGAGY